MLSRLGKVSAAIIIAGGAVLLRAEPASAAMSTEFCDASQASAACTAAQTYWYMSGDEYYCGQHNGVCTTDGEYIYFGVNYYNNGTTPCPAVLPC